MRPEGRLVVLCAGTLLNEFVGVEVVDLVSDGIDWDVVWQLSRAHGVAHLVYRNLTTICPAAVPPTIHESFRQSNGPGTNPAPDVRLLPEHQALQRGDQ